MASVESHAQNIGPAILGSARELLAKNSVDWFGQQICWRLSLKNDYTARNVPQILEDNWPSQWNSKGQSYKQLDQDLHEIGLSNSSTNHAEIEVTTIEEQRRILHALEALVKLPEPSVIETQSINEQIEQNDERIALNNVINKIQLACPPSSATKARLRIDYSTAQSHHPHNGHNTQYAVLFREVMNLVPRNLIENITAILPMSVELCDQGLIVHLTSQQELDTMLKLSEQFPIAERPVTIARYNIEA